MGYNENKKVRHSCATHSLKSIRHNRYFVGKEASRTLADLLSDWNCDCSKQNYTKNISLRPNSIQDWFNPVDDDILHIQGGLNLLDALHKQRGKHWFSISYIRLKPYLFSCKNSFSFKCAAQGNPGKIHGLYYYLFIALLSYQFKPTM